MYKRSGVALVLAVLMVLAGILMPDQPALAATNSDRNVSLTITSDPDSTGVNVVVFVTSRLKPALGQTLGFDLSISTPGDSKFERSWAGNPNENPGIYSGAEVKWSGSVQNGQTQGPYVARFSGNVPFAIHAYIQYYGPATGNLRSRQLITGGLNGLTVAPVGDTLYSGMQTVFASPEGLKGIVDNSSTCGCSWGLFVLFVDPSSPAGQLKPSDQIVSINGQAIHDIDDFNRITIPFKRGATPTFIVQRGTEKLSITIPLTRYYTLDALNQIYGYLDSQLKKEPNNPRLLFTDAILLYSLGLYDGTISDADKLIKVAPNAAEAYIIRADAYVDKAEEEAAYDDEAAAEDRQKALADLVKAGQIDSTNYYIEFLQGLVYHGMSDFTNAETHLLLSLKRNPTYSVSNYYMGRITLEQKEDAAGSMQYFDQAIKSYPYYAAAYYRRGLANVALGNIEAARRDFSLAIYYDINGSISARALAAYRSIANK